MKIDNNYKIKEWIHYSIGQSTMLQELDKKRLTLSDINLTQNRRNLKMDPISFVALTSIIPS